MFASIALALILTGKPTTAPPPPMVEVVPGVTVAIDQAPATVAYLTAMAVEAGTLMWVDGELVTRTLDWTVWDDLRTCELNGVGWHDDGPGPFLGAHQWAGSTWAKYGGQYAATPAGATIDQQLAAARENLTVSGWGQWPGCSRKLGYR